MTRKRITLAALLGVAMLLANVTPTGWTWLRFGRTATAFDRAGWNERVWSQEENDYVCPDCPRMAYDVFYGHDVCRLSRSQIHRLLGPPDDRPPSNMERYRIGKPWYSSLQLGLDVFYDGERVVGCRIAGP